MTIPFFKMHGAANDFIVVDDRNLVFPAQDTEWLAAIMRRNTGVGSEGVLLIQPSDTAHFRMRFFNPDGGEVDMCGNGARCIARLAFDLGVAPARMQFDTLAGIVGAEVNGDTVCLTMTEPHDWRMQQMLTIGGREMPYHFVNSGVPHVVMEVADLDALDIQRLGAAVRYHEAFAPAGTNANFIEITGPQSLRLRTYERGVEAETPACGTGIVACGLLAGRAGRVAPPVTIHSAGGHALVVDYEPTETGAQRVTLTGPAEYVFQGTLHHPLP
jgi:diaminopimelate epimerase